MSTLFEKMNVNEVKGALIFLDIDGTLVADDEDSPTKAVLKKVEELKKVACVYLCSNSLNHARNAIVAKKTKLPIVKGYRKPNKKILTCIKKNDFKLSGKKREIIVIGDKVLTDGLFAYRINAHFIKVERKLKNERLIIKLYNLLDDTAYLFLKPFV